jgi:hypothetical protein
MLRRVDRYIVNDVSEGSSGFVFRLGLSAKSSLLGHENRHPALVNRVKWTRVAGIFNVYVILKCKSYVVVFLS